MLLSLDAEKAFDRVDWGFLAATLSQIGLGHKMTSRILALYSCPQAQVRINGQLSAPFHIRNGTRQGCPLSPLLYVLCMEHLLNHIRDNPDIKGLSLSSGHYKCSVYADDLLLFLSSPITTLPSLLTAIQLFSFYSNYKINPSKSEAMNISLPPTVVRALQASFPFKWQSKSLKYLGIHVPADLADSYRVNFPPLLHTLKADMSRWECGDISWLGRVNAYKMNILPRLLYLFAGVPVHLPRSFFKEVTAMQTRFVWAHKHPRLARHILVRRKTEGGLALPDPLLYHLAAVLTRVLDCFHHGRDKQWIALETTAAGVNPKSLLWLPRGSRLTRLLSALPPIMSSIARARATYLSRSSLFSSDGPLIPLFDSDTFPPARTSPTFLSFSRTEGTSFHSLLSSTDLKPLPDILGSGSPTPLQSFQYFQLRHFYQTHKLKLDLHRPLSHFERLCTSTTRSYRAVSSLYALLDEHSTTPLPFRSSWERELHHPLSDEDWRRALTVCHKMTMSCKAQETNYKVLTRWYRVPALLSRIYPTVPDVCWRCGNQGGTMLHIWVTCPMLDQFWTQVLDIMSRLVSCQIHKSPQLLLLSIPPAPLPTHASRLLSFLLIAARSVIPRLWKSASPPTVSSWLQEVALVHRMEELTADSRRQLDKFHLIWNPWTDYMSSTEFTNSHLGTCPNPPPLPSPHT